MSNHIRIVHTFPPFLSLFLFDFLFLPLQSLVSPCSKIIITHKECIVVCMALVLGHHQGNLNGKRPMNSTV